MAKIIQAIFENGIFRPLEKVSLPEQQKVEIIIEEDEISTKIISVVAERSSSFHFLKEPQEDIYTVKDGEAV